jgi:colicin import membrane protein
MAKAPRHLKVFQTRIGFFDCIIAAPSQPAALRAWGIHQNLFASGTASAVTDPDIIALAKAQPGIPLQRAIGSNTPFSSAPSLPTLPAEPRTKPAPKPPDRTKLDRAEKHLADLVAEQAAAERIFNTRRAEAQADIKTCREAYRKAGGKA